MAPGALIDDLFLNALRDLDVVRGLHRVLTASLRAGTEVGGIAEHLGEGNERIDLLRAVAGLEALDLTAAAVEVAWQASLNAMEPAILNAISEESTSW